MPSNLVFVTKVFGPFAMADNTAIYDANEYF